MVPFRYQLEWAAGYLDVWLNIILSVTVRAFLGAIDIWISELGRTNYVL